VNGKCRWFNVQGSRFNVEKRQAGTDGRCKETNMQGNGNLKETMDVTAKITFIKTFDPDGAARLERLLGKEETLKTAGNVYKERFTGRQFSLVFDPLLDVVFERARILEVLSKSNDTIPGIATRLGIGKDKVFNHTKDLMRKNLIEIASHAGRDALFRKK